MNESPLFSCTYDLLLWLLPQVAKFPRVHRFGLAERITRRALDFHETILAGALTSGQEQRACQRRADAQLRQLIRLAKDLNCLSISQYEHAAGLVTEVGRLLGGWIKSLEGRASRDMSTS
jgi:hypothetical protein